MPDAGSPSSPGARPGTSPYIWTRGTWFGPLVGCTLWMLLTSLATFRLDGPAALTVLAAYLVANALGIQLWSRRKTLRAVVALQVQLGVTCALALIALIVVDQRVGLAHLDGGLGEGMVFAALGVYPILMFMFWMRGRAAAN